MLPIWNSNLSVLRLFQIQDFDTQLSAQQGDLRVMISTACSGRHLSSKSLPVPPIQNNGQVKNLADDL
jgi:hypothetical protein